MTGKVTARIWKVEEAGGESLSDQLAVEEPLEVRLGWQGQGRVVAVTMRTPGNDAELAAGFLHAEGVVDRPGRIAGIHTVAPNVVQVELGDGPEPELAPLDRHFFATSACGVCGKAGLETLRLRVAAELPPGPPQPIISPEVLRALPGRLREAQGLFAATGGLHAAALFDAEGHLLDVREDVGRHNALDKLLGRAFLDSRLPLHGHLVMVSGRSSYEILQKCVAARVPVVCAVSAPSSLAVELAERFGVTLIGFLRGDRFNVYSGIERLAIDLPESCSHRRRQRLLPIAL